MSSIDVHTYTTIYIIYLKYQRDIGLYISVMITRFTVPRNSLLSSSITIIYINHIGNMLLYSLST